MSEPLQCSTCNKVCGSNGFMSKSQQKKPLDKRRCISCVENCQNVSEQKLSSQVCNGQTDDVLLGVHDNKKDSKLKHNKEKSVNTSNNQESLQIENSRKRKIDDDEMTT